MTNKPLTKRQQEVFDFIVAYKKAHDGNSPTLREIGKKVALLSTSTVTYYLNQLEEEGLIEISPGGARNIRVVGGRWEYQPVGETVG